MLLMPLRVRTMAQVDWFKRVIDILTLLVITIGLYFAWDQAKKLTESVQLNNKAINLATWASVSNQSMEVDKIFIQNPEFQRYFGDKVKIAENDPNYKKAKAIAFLLLDFLESGLTIVEYLSEGFAESIVEKDAWHTYVKTMFQSSPILCKQYTENKSNYGSTLRRHADAACASASEKL